MTPDPPAGASCFIDANILVYYFVNNPSFSMPCHEFIQRIAAGDVAAFTSPMVISEALHRIMLSEVQVRFSTPKPLAYVQRHPQIIPQLSLYHSAAKTLPALSIQLLNVDVATFAATSTFAAASFLLTDDASIIALMQRHNIEYLISNDDDFGTIAAITVCKPR